MVPSSPGLRRESSMMLQLRGRPRLMLSFTMAIGNGLWLSLGNPITLGRHLPPPPETSVADRVIWTADPSGRFIWRSAYQEFRPRGNVVSWCHLVWFSKAIPRHSFLLWLAVQERLKRIEFIVLQISKAWIVSFVDKLWKIMTISFFIVTLQVAFGRSFWGNVVFLGQKCELGQFPGMGFKWMERGAKSEKEIDSWYCGVYPLARKKC